MNVTHDLVRQDQVTLTYNVMCEGYTLGFCVFELKNLKNLKNETKLVVLASLDPEKYKFMFSVT